MISVCLVVPLVFILISLFVVTRISSIETSLSLYYLTLVFRLLLADLENYILKHISSYSANPCLFAGITDTVEFKRKINEFYNGNRKKSMKSTIVFKAHSSRTTLAHKILLKNGNLYLYIDQVLKDKTKRKKRKIVSVGKCIIHYS